MVWMKKPKIVTLDDVSNLVFGIRRLLDLKSAVHRDKSSSILTKHKNQYVPKLRKNFNLL